MSRYIIKVNFVNNDTCVEWFNIYIKNKIPDKEWMKFLYDGVNEPQDMTVLGVIAPLKETCVFCHGNKIEFNDLNEGGMPEQDGSTIYEGSCPTCSKIINLSYSKEETDMWS
jgi:hypothetical protein